MNLYIDESGSLTKKHLHHRINHKFIISIVKVDDYSDLKQAYRRFVAKELHNLRGTGTNSMFRNNNFFELKGSAMSIELQRRFINFFSSKNNFELFYLIIDNEKMPERFFNKTSRIFNYTLKEAMINFTKLGYLERGHIFLHIDDRNVKRETKDTLEEYLNTEVAMILDLQDKFDVEYYFSEQNKLVQIADVFSNIMFRHQKHNYYDKEFEMLRKKGILKSVYCFPEMCDIKEIVKK